MYHGGTLVAPSGGVGGVVVSCGVSLGAAETLVCIELVILVGFTKLTATKNYF